MESLKRFFRVAIRSPWLIVLCVVFGLMLIAYAVMLIHNYLQKDKKRSIGLGFEVDKADKTKAEAIKKQAMKTQEAIKELLK